MATVIRYTPHEDNDRTIVATMDDGRIMHVILQYGRVLPHGRHADDCEQVSRIGGHCTCGLLDGVDIDAVLAGARAYIRETPATPATQETADDTQDTIPARRGLCPACGTYCYGDCEA